MRFDWCLRRILVTAVLLACLPACGGRPSEAALRERIDALEAATEAGDASSYDDLLADDFIGNDGIDRTQAKRLLQAMKLRHRNLRATLGPVALRIDGDRATAEFTAAASGGPGVLPETVQIYAVRSGWRFEQGAWRLTSADWTPDIGR